MTHESFKDIVSFYEVYDADKINKFLDSEIEDELLSRWFKQWQSGNFRPIFDEIEFLNETYFATRSNRELPEIAFTKPKDADMPRKKENGNFVRR